eukprot:CAMPEP_0202892840 /NCGR_PEP_ID=MMETSP1392-20130828/2522_1 /ASSEMBLY_ACC=CAM_ASM_000868 /TAXON_ID=225041 /ORGANISM="Chlamydomonas chlamydogama, Strain SAG 11-48b" /LENGTH=31 /DNA_ID= /DNA_START= /DNA_END= /DNA_ORIENTATION=
MPQQQVTQGLVQEVGCNHEGPAVLVLGQGMV